jgi:hypothetical protein
MLATSGLVFFAINHQLFFATDQLRSSLDFEMKHVLQGEGGISKRVPHLYYLERITEVMSPALLAASGIFVAWALWTRRGAGWLLTCFAVLYLVVLSSSPKIAMRYLLPVTGAGCVFAAAGIALILQQIRRPAVSLWVPRSAAVGALVLTVAICTMQGRELSKMMASFRKDSRSELAEWIMANLPEGSTVAYETKVGLGWLTDRVPELQGFELVRKDYIADMGTVDELRVRGVRCIAVYGINRGFHRGKQHFPQPAVREAFERRRDFYLQLDSDAKLVWRRKQGPSAYLLPDLRLYDLTAKQP